MPLLFLAHMHGEPCSSLLHREASKVHKGESTGPMICDPKEKQQKTRRWPPLYSSHAPRLVVLLSREHFCFPPGRTKFSSALNTKPLLFLSFVVTVTLACLSLFCDVDYCGKPCITEDTSVPDSPPLDFSRLYTGFRCVKPYVALLGVCVCPVHIVSPSL